MPDFTITDIPDELLVNLRRSARANRRSLSNEVLVRLERSIGIRPIDPRDLNVRARPLSSLPEPPPNSGSDL
jgi:hypothetical protein